jgi:hypothetical protein
VHRKFGTGREGRRSVLRTTRFVDVLYQRSTHRDIHELDAAAHREDGNTKLKSGTQKSDFEVVLETIDTVGGGMRLLSVQLGVDIGPSHQEQSVEPPDKVDSDLVGDVLR